ncbi:MAG: hypothetical protein KKA54_00700 [Proteobacteria bacterium]|nr:hypothetical protein [Pseudomonadota bacterium]
MTIHVSSPKSCLFNAVLVPSFACLSVLFPAPANADMVSDGSDGPFHPLQNTVIDLAGQNVFNFTTITIPDGVKVSFINTIGSVPVYFLATDDIVIDGTLDASGGSSAGPGGYVGGLGGLDGAPGQPGFGPGGGYGGIYRHPGGGSSFATTGTETKIDGCLSEILPPAPPVPYEQDLFEGGSGGGGGGGGAYGVDGCKGGSGGGAVYLSTPWTISIEGNVYARGANGVNCYTSALCGIRGGPGGGGSGGMIRLSADTIILEPDGVLNCIGGKGGVRSLDATLTPYGGNGGYGYIAIKAPHLDLSGDILGALILNDCVVDFDNDADIDGVDASRMAANLDSVCLNYFAESFGRLY